MQCLCGSRQAQDKSGFVSAEQITLIGHHDSCTVEFLGDLGFLLLRQTTGPPEYSILIPWPQQKLELVDRQKMEMIDRQKRERVDRDGSGED